ncbi:neprilysin-1-like [Drosophila rhopaloa]|uniref:Neprilysin-2-like n=1 Tax=Drosophila rhopaloa TaxID=1041015 RepID=A0ABM5HIT1_DRORH|nr:neprilysin-1-like [Drosophila rhopaloa]
MNKILCSIGLFSAGLCGAVIYFLLIEFSWNGDARTVTQIDKSSMDFRQSHSDFMKSYMNFSVEPCDDFYEYACGNYKFARPDRHSEFRRVSMLDIYYTLADITSQLVGRTDLAEALNVSSELMVAQRFYNACLGAELYPFPAADPAYLRLIRSIGGFPAVDGAAWNASNFDWYNMSVELINYGAKGLVIETLRSRHPFDRILNVPVFGFEEFVDKHNIDNNTSRSYQFNAERMRGYLQSYNLPEAKIAEVIEGVFAFWHEALVRRSKTLIEFKDMISMVCSRHKEAVANYLAMKLLFAFDAKLPATKYQRDYCALTLMESMPFLFDKLYMAEHFTEEKKFEVTEIVGALRKSLRKLLRTQPELLGKESGLLSYVGSVKDDDRTDRLIREIGSLKIDEGSYAETNINLKRLTVNIESFSIRHAEHLPKDSKPQDFLLGMNVGGTYSFAFNSIEIFAGTLHPPVYHRSMPRSLKYGSLGSIVGHELTHSFEITKYYKDHAECFVSQYSKYHIDGVQTQDENMADNGGLRIAFEAFRSQVDPGQDIPSEQMPGLDLLPDQLFFLGFAQYLCSDNKEENYTNSNDPHSFEKFRVLGALSNSEDFFQAFNCPVGSGMRPTSEHCQLW